MNGDGYVKTYADRQPVTAFNGTDHKSYGSNVYNEMGNYLEISFYRDERAEAINAILILACIEACS